MSSLSTSCYMGMAHTSASHYGNSPPMRDGVTISSGAFISALSTIKANNARAIWGCFGSSGNMSWISGNGQSAYSHGMFKAAVDRAVATTSAAQMHAFVNGGTLVAVYINDDIEPGSVYPGGSPTLAEIEDGATYVKSFWSKVPVCVRSRLGYLKGKSDWSSLDFGWSQWKNSRGNPTTFFTNEVNDGRGVGLGVMLGYNLLNGGVGTAPWNQHPDLATQFGMSPTEINAIAAAFSVVTLCVGMHGWKHDQKDGTTSYYDDPQINAALTNLANKAVGRAIGPISWHTATGGPSGGTSASTQTVGGSWVLTDPGFKIRNSDVASQSIQLPTRPQGEMLGVLTYSRDSARSAVMPSAWSLAKSVSGSSARGGQLALFVKVATGNEISETVTWAGAGGAGSSVVCQSFSFSGNTTVQAGLISTAGSARSWSVGTALGPVGGLTSAVSDALVLVCVGKTNDWNSGDPPADATVSATTTVSETWKRAFIVTNGSGDDSGIFMDWTALSGTPSIASKAWSQLTNTGSSSNGSGVGFMVSFRPAAVVAGTPPSITELVDLTISTLSTLSFTPSSTGSTPITWSVNTGVAPSVVTFSTSNGGFIWTPGAGGEGAYPFVLTATNTFGADTEAFTATVVSSGTTGSIVSSVDTSSGSTVTVLSGSSGTSFTQNVAPVILNPGNQNARTGERVSLFIQCADADNDPLICTLEPSTAPVGSFFDPNSNQFLWTPLVAGTYPFSIVASDGQHESRSTFTISVADSRWHRSGRLPTTVFGQTNSSGNAFKRI